jgi:hypothetical protein
VPWLLFTLLIWPLLMWCAYRAAGNSIPIWQAWQMRQPFLDSGPLWFVQILLYVSLLHALWAWRGYGRELEPRTISLVLRAIAAALVIMAATGVTNLSQDDIPFLGGWHWQALTLDVAEAALVVAGSVWLLALA